MALRRLGKDPESKSGGSPTVYLDEERDTYLVQGWITTNPSPSPTAGPSGRSSAWPRPDPIPSQSQRRWPRCSAVSSSRRREPQRGRRW